MNKTYRAAVVLPASYAKNKKASYPVLYLLHGACGHFADWLRQTPDKLLVQKLADQYHLIVVMPEGETFGFFLDSPLNASSQFETHLTKEVLPKIDQTYRTVRDRKGRVIAGLSMGGHGALYLSARHPDLFSAAGSMSGALDFSSANRKLTPDEVKFRMTLFALILGMFFNTDSRKQLALSMNGGMRAYEPDERLARPRRLGFGVSFYPRYRVSNRLTFRYGLEFNLARNQIGYVNGGLDFDEVRDRPLIQALGGDTLTRRGPEDVLLGRRTVATLSNVLSTAYTFTNRMSFTLRVRQYTSNVHYADFARLRPEGEETPVAYARNRDNTYNAFNVDAVYSWWFAPGSQLSVVWKNAGATFLQAEEATPQFFDNFNNTINTPHNNSVSLKLLYFLDYLALRKNGPR